MERLSLNRKEKRKKPKIVPELAALGVYAQSVKPKKDWLNQGTRNSLLSLPCPLTFELTTGLAEPENPLHLFVNISESAMKSIIPSQIQEFVLRGSSRQVRIYPKGTRIESNNYNPVTYWRAGGQICAQNWQKFDKGMQLTRAMFEGTDGWLLKPENLLGKYRKEGEDGVEREKDAKMQILTVEILGLSSGTSLFLTLYTLTLTNDTLSSHPT